MKLIDGDILYRKLGWSTRDCELAEIIEKIPTIDAVEVVRCKDCKYYVDELTYCVPHCSKSLKGMKKDDFCSYGERKEE